ncbi:MAG TPA: GWxTD domain-containing protein [Thermoanaerobaculia bacterium]|nr:GWxTD domain-containing protein [Thermoanaerobaculia bacterium]
MLLFALLFALAPKYHQWAASPQAYFMTNAERAQWTAITDDAAAEEFIKKFVASRGPDFVSEVATRAAIADKYLTVGKTPGSKSLRGKVIILLGPPTSMSVSNRVEKGEHSGTSAMYMNAGLNDGGISVGDMADAAQRDALTGKSFRDFTFSYPGFTVTVTANADSGADGITDRAQAAELQKRFDAAASAPIVKTTK